MAVVIIGVFLFFLFKCGTFMRTKYLRFVTALLPFFEKSGCFLGVPVFSMLHIGLCNYITRVKNIISSKKMNVSSIFRFFGFREGFEKN